MTRGKACELGLSDSHILAVLRSYAVCGVAPEIMGVAPIVAIPKALKMAKLKLNDIDLFEINEAFAAQCVHCVKALNVDIAKVNVNGGAIALGHPVGSTGTRMIVTLIHEMQRRKAKYGVASMCISSGMGAALVIEREGE